MPPTDMCRDPGYTSNGGLQPGERREIQRQKSHLVHFANGRMRCKNGCLTARNRKREDVAYTLHAGGEIEPWPDNLSLASITQEPNLLRGSLRAIRHRLLRRPAGTAVAL